MQALSDLRMKQIFVVLCDAAIIAISFCLSYLLRLGSIELLPFINQIISTLPIVLFIRLSVFSMMGLYRGMWRFVGMRDLLTLIKAVTFSTLAIIVILFIVFRLENYPRSVFFIDWFVVLVLVGGARFSYRYYRDMRSRAGTRTGEKGIAVLIVGAGRSGELILREILGNYQLSYNVKGFVDDNRKKRNQTIHGYRVLGNTRDIPRLVSHHKIKEVFLAIPNAPTKAKRRIMHICKSAKVTFKTLPDMGELLTGRVRVSDLREFQIEDILGRDAVHLDTRSIREYIRDKTILITGAGGSIGSELCRQISQFLPAKMVLLDQSEYNLYTIEMYLREHAPNVEQYAVIGDILNQSKMERILKQHRPEVVFHAAAYKHVPLMETNPEEALRTNTFGTWTIARLSHLHGVQKFVMISTDKAVRPTNVMGASKRIAEILCQEFGRTSTTKFVTVRFGNVLNSVGSVIPLFKRQIATGGPVTVTHPEIYRYFMTIPEAVQLIMQAGAMGQGGEVFILDMGEPVRIVDLARDMITLSGLEPERDIRIVFTGLRPGEKMYEELLTDSEEVTSTLHEKIKVVKTSAFDWPPLLDKIEKLLDSLRIGHKSEIVESIKSIVPDYQPEQGGRELSGQKNSATPLVELSQKPTVSGTDALLQ